MNVDISHLHVQNLPWAPVYMFIILLIISFCTHVIVFLSAHPKLNLPSTTKTKTKNPALLGVCIDSSITIYEVHATMLGNESYGRPEGWREFEELYIDETYLIHLRGMLSQRPLGREMSTGTQTHVNTHKIHTTSGQRHTGRLPYSLHGGQHTWAPTKVPDIKAIFI